LDLYIIAIQSTAFVIPGPPAQYSLGHLPESISAMRTDGQAIDPRTAFSPYLVALGIHSLQQGNRAIIIEQVALVIKRVLPILDPLKVWVMSLSRNYGNNLYQVTYLGQKQGQRLIASSTPLPGSLVQLAPGEGDSLAIRVASRIPIDLQFTFQVTYRLINESQLRTLTLPQVFEVAFFLATSNWHLYRLQGGRLMEVPPP